MNERMNERTIDRHVRNPPPKDAKTRATTTYLWAKPTLSERHVVWKRVLFSDGSSTSQSRRASSCADGVDDD
jgi:hypothetical protein